MDSVSRPTPTEFKGASQPPWRLASTYADHIRNLPVKETGMVRIGREPVEWKTARATGRDSVIVRFRTAPLMTGHLVPADGWVVIYAPMGWRDDYIFNGREAQPGDVSVVTSRTGYVSTGRNRDVLGIGLRAATLKRAISALSGRFEDDVPLWDCTLELGDVVGAAFRHEVLLVQKEAFATPNAPGSFLIPPPDEARLFEHVARTLIQVYRNPRLIHDHFTSDLKVVSAARDAANANPSLVSLSDLCVAARVGQTRLHESFVSVHGISPARYLRQLRLTRVQERLCDAVSPPLSVKEAALSLGFTHGGRFASEYKKIFGESPSSTLNRTLRGR